MRMQLFEIETRKPRNVPVVFLVAPSEQRAGEILREHERTEPERGGAYTIQRIDDIIEPAVTKGLDDMLNHAPEGFATFTDAAGWFVYQGISAGLYLFILTNTEDREYMVIAPSIEMATAIYVEHALRAEVKISANVRRGDLSNVPAEHLASLVDILEFGPIGVIHLDEKNGWSFV